MRNQVIDGEGDRRGVTTVSVSLELSNPCSCGSGNIYRICCAHEHAIELAKNNDSSIFPGVSIPAAVEGLARVYHLPDGDYRRPLDQPFHDFAVERLVAMLGRPWVDREARRPAPSRHIVVKWLFDRDEFFRRPEVRALRPSEQVVPSGAVYELTILASDLLCLRLLGAAPSALLRRLRDPEQFQGARYEIAIAATLARVGFDIKWRAPDSRRKQPEFDARHKVSGEVLAVETKSKHHPGVYGRQGELPPEEELRTSIFRLFNDAQLHRPGDRPFVIAIELNVPQQEHLPLPQRTWLQRILEKAASPAGAEMWGDYPPTAIWVTNSPWHLFGDETAKLGESMLAFPDNPEHPLRSLVTLAALYRARNSMGQFWREEWQVGRLPRFL